MRAPTRLPQPELIARCRARPTFVLVGGVPGAGKSTLLAGIDRPASQTLDPDRYRRFFARAFPTAPYRSYRLLVHLLHASATLGTITFGQVDSDQHSLLVHNPATRAGRRDLVGRLARACGWRTVLVLIDVSRDVALEGQHRRGRVINSGSFERHWQRWSAGRGRLTAAAETRTQLDGWDEVHVVDRQHAAALIEQILPGIE